MIGLAVKLARPPSNACSRGFLLGRSTFVPESHKVAFVVTASSTEPTKFVGSKLATG
jgi:hypothetical protein